MAEIFHLDEIAKDLQVDTLVINFRDSLVDAGNTCQTINATVETLEGESIGRFNSDLLYDYRAQRPIVTYGDGRLRDILMPEMILALCTDVHGKNFLYLTGEEPDFRWNEIASTIVKIVKHFNVQTTFSFAAMPAPVPHTRPVDMLIRSTKPDGQYPVVKGMAQHHGELTDVFEFKAEEEGLAVVNIRVRVPFYLARGDDPFFAGALAAVKMLATCGGPTFPLGDLEQLEDAQRKAISQLQLEGSDFAEVLAKLEEDYDTSGVGYITNDDATPTIPSSEEIGDAVEQFLALQNSSPLDLLNKPKQDNHVPKDPTLFDLSSRHADSDHEQRQDGAHDGEETEE
ncbi:PAC2 family protein [Trueperella bialowiezensis]|uniref:PAC2 family n=1 Tax=Trueperella bialowiezensis TaxID=312285 RepID=A0A448PCG1_9ACTO|nr:PAC2 family protein [Trueperella bialowiezensis]VEI12614.1 PAC2 family [Trueperella bialowiezensis]